MKLDLVLDEVQLPWRPTDDWTARARTMIAGVGTDDVAVQCVLTDDATLREHNRSYRDRDAATDVLSFSYLDGHEEHARDILEGRRAVRDFLDEPVHEGEDALAGQILVSLQTLTARGALHAADLDGEVAFMVAHGFLHVIGFDHADDDAAAAMEAAENALMRRGGFAVATAPPDDLAGGPR